MKAFEREDFDFNPFTGEKINKSHILKYVKEPEPFSKIKEFITEYNPEDLIYMRQHKNTMVAIRDKHDKGSPYHKLFDLEIQRTILFLERFQ